MTLICVMISNLRLIITTHHCVLKKKKKISVWTVTILAISNLSFWKRITIIVIHEIISIIVIISKSGQFKTYVEYEAGKKASN